MIFLHGIYKFAKKRVGFRNDFCTSCKAERVAEQYRTFNVWHFFFIPLVPLGNHTRWHCVECGSDPRSSTKESPFLLIVGMILFAAVGLISLLALITAKQDRMMLACVGLGFLAAAFGLWKLLKWQSQTPEGPESEVKPLTGDTCPYCAGKMIDEPNCHCSSCGVRRY